MLPITNTESRWIVTQIGARQSYAVPRALALHGRLRCFFTDAWNPFPGWLPVVGPRAFRALFGRFHEQLRSQSVVAFTGGAVAQRVRSAWTRSTDYVPFYTQHLRVSEWFDRRTKKSLAKQKFDPRRDRFFAFNTACLDTLRFMRTQGVPTAVDQMDPARVEMDLIVEERKRWPGWAGRQGRIPDEFFERLDAEWREADRVVVNSNWTAQGLITQGVPAEKIVVVPQAFEPTGPRPPERQAHRNRLRVLWLGSVLLRKGIPYLIEAAKQLPHVEFQIVGPINISPMAQATAPANVIWHGQVVRDEAAQHYRAADVFVLPTISDGFAITQLEAMSYGLPVVVTSNCGDVVTHGVDGMIVPPRDSERLASAIAEIDADRPRLAAMSAAALATARRFSLDLYGRRLLDVFPG